MHRTYSLSCASSGLTQFCNTTVFEAMSACHLLFSATNAHCRTLQQGKGGFDHHFPSSQLVQEEESSPTLCLRRTHCTTEEDVLSRSVPIYSLIPLYSKFIIIRCMYKFHPRPRLYISRHRQGHGSGMLNPNHLRLLSR